MQESKRILPLLMIIVMVASAFLVAISTPAAMAEEEPTRASLYQTSESYNVSFNKPTFYTNDPYPPNPADPKLENNTWDDIAMVVFFQAQQKTSKTVGSSTFSVAEMYQAVFVEVDDTQVSTGTSRRVLLEDFTAAWCGPCRGVIGAMDRINHDSNYFPNKYIGVEWHASSNNDVYYTSASGASARASYYGVPGYPTVVIDGDDPSVGGGNSNDTTIDAGLKARINTAAGTAAPLSIVATAGHDSSKTWVNFTVTVEDQTFDNVKVDANVILIQDAWPRRHNNGKDSRLGWIVQNHKQFRVFDITGTPPEISVTSPPDGATVSGDVPISFTTTDADASDDKIIETVGVRQTGTSEWTPIKKTGGNFIWKTATQTGGEYDFPDGDYEVKVTAIDFWDEMSEFTFDLTVLNPDTPELVLDNTNMQDQLDLDGVMEGTFNILWNGEDDEDGTDLTVDLFYTRPDIDWMVVAEDVPNTGSYAWDTTDPRVPDGDRYVVKVKVTDNDDMSTELESNFGFEINNADPPMISIQSPQKDQELSGEPIIRWTATDDESSAIDLTIDAYISEDDGVSWDPIKMGAPSTGSLKFDSTYYTDGGSYKIKLVATDPTGLSAEDITETFYIYNNDIPEVNILDPDDDDLVTGTITIEWSSYDEEDADEDLTYTISYKHSAGTFWKELAGNVPNTGSYELDTTELDEGDGVYTIKVELTDKRDEVSPASTVFFTVYNPDEPEIISASGPTSEVEDKATFTWYAEDKDPGETDQLKIWFYRSEDGTNWEIVAEGLPNTGSYKMNVANLEDGSYYVKMIIADCQEGEFNKTVEHLYPPINVNNNDPPTIEVTQGVDPGSVYDESVTIGWDSSDPEGDKLFYSVFYRRIGSETWIPVTGATDIIMTTYTIDTSNLDEGDYEIRITAKEEERGGFETEVLTESFTVKHVEDIIDDDDDDIIGDDDDSESSSSNGMVLVAVFAVFAIIIIIALVAVGIVIMRRKQAEAQLPPPGGIAGQLPGSNVAQGQLPQQNTAQLPPAPAPQQSAPAPQPQTPASLQTTAPPPSPETVPADQPVQEAPAPATTPGPAPVQEQTVEMPAPQQPPAQ